MSGAAGPQAKSRRSVTPLDPISWYLADHVTRSTLGVPGDGGDHDRRPQALVNATDTRVRREKRLNDSHTYRIFQRGLLRENTRGKIVLRRGQARARNAEPEPWPLHENVGSRH